MPYMAATNREIELSRVACLLDEFDGKPLVEGFWNGYHYEVYGMPVDADGWRKELIARIEDADLSKQSLEMQTWWQVHQEAEHSRLQIEHFQSKAETDKRSALSKLTARDRKLLGL